MVVGPIQLRAGLRAAYPEPPASLPEEPVASQAPLDVPTSDDDTTPQWGEAPLAARGTASTESDIQGESSAAAGGSKPRDVSTRIILRALLQVLIEKDVITRGELLAAVDEIRGPKHEDGPEG